MDLILIFDYFESRGLIVEAMRVYVKFCHKAVAIEWISTQEN